VAFATTEAIVRRADATGATILRIPKRGSQYAVDLCVARQPHAPQCDANGQGELAMAVLSDAAANVFRWHYRTGHIGKRSLADLAQSAAVRGLEALPAARIDELLSAQPQCHGCAVGKATRKAFTRHNSGAPASEILDVMHADVKGPINVPSAGGKRYVLCLTDEKSRRTWGFLLKQKSETAALIQALIAQLQVETGKLLRVFHADNGGEFVALVPWLHSRGIRWDPTTPGTPNHNSIAERAWRTIFNATRAMLHHAGLPLSLWGHAVQTAILLKNKTLTSVNGALTPEVIWQQQAWALAHPHALTAPPTFVTEMKNLRVFGCNAYIHLQGRKALDARAARGVFLGYADEPKGYYFVFNVETKKLIRSRDVRFDEDEFSFAREIDGVKGQLLPQSPEASHEPVPAPAVNAPQHAGAAGHVAAPKPSDAAEPAAEDASDADESPAAAAQGERGYESDGAAAADDEAADADEPAAPAADPGVAALDNVRSPLKAKVIFDAVRPSNIVQGRRARPQVNYTESARAKPAPVHALYVVQPADDAAASDADSDSHVEVEDPEPDFTPNTWRQAMSCKNAAHWKRAADDEIRGMQLSGSYVLVPRPTSPGSNVIDSKWVWKKKLDQFGRVKRFRARLVARGFKQIEGVDFFETFAPVMRYKSLLILLAWAAAHDYEVRHLDVPKAFLQATLDEEIFMEQPEGYHDSDRSKVWKLLRSVYGIRQAPNNWNHELNRFLLSLGFTRLKSDPCIYVKQCHNTGRQIVLGVFVDDIIPVFDRADDAAEWQPVLRALQAKYQIVDTGDATLVLGIRLTRDRASRTLRLDHAPYIAKMLKEFQMEQCNPVPTPSGLYAISKADCPAEADVQLRALYQRIVGSLNYAAISVRPDIAFAVNTLARYLQQPGDAHLTAAKRVLRYLRHTADMGIVLGGKREECQATTITVWSDADWATNSDNRRSITGYVVQVDGDIVSWHSKQQTIVAKSTCEAEMYALSAAVSEAKWIRMFVRELVGQQQAPVIHTVAHVDNTAAIAVGKNDVHHSRTKHIDLRHHHVREAVEKNLLRLEHVPSAEQLADILTKPLALVAFERLRDRLVR
jgi:transposase InsO family protein